MSRSLFFVAVAVAALSATASAATAPTNVGTFAVTNPGFLTLAKVAGDTDGPDLVITQFTGNPFAKDGISVVPNVGANIKTPASMAPKLLTNNCTWPNEPNAVPAAALSPPFPGVAVGAGFLVPGKSNGAVLMVTTTGSDAGTVVDVAPQDSGWFYHRVMWKDMNGDGKLDILTARATKPIFGSAAGELLWLEQPTSGDPLSPVNVPWQNHSLVTGAMSPDVFFTLGDVNGDGDDEVVYSSFFTGGGLGFIAAPGGDWSDPTKLTNTVVDTQPGPMFDVQLTDLNADGKTEVLATSNGADGSVYAYEVPASGADVTDPSAWTRHVLATGFKPKGWGPGKGAPGRSVAFQPQTGGKDAPTIAVSGDDDGNMYLLEPTMTAFNYTKTILLSCGGTVGEPAIGDADGDGFTELFVPCYSGGKVNVFTYASS